jgi:hypothetical protein
VLVDLSYSLLFEGFFVRGAIVKGRLYHDDEMVFGEALVKAYSLENEVARYPQIMITSDVVADAKIYDNNFLTELVRKASDGPYFF